MNLKTVRGLLFLTYLTKYNIPQMYYFLHKYEDAETLWATEMVGREGPKLDVLFEETEISFEKLKYFDVTAIPYFSKAYPALLRQLKSMPPMLYTRGQLKQIDSVAIVGTRHITPYGERLTDVIGEIIIRSGHGIVSGLADGVDSKAHNVAIANGGYTVAVMATPLNAIYPKRNYALANRIIESGGALVSELAFDINRGGQSFIQRNRIQVALSKAVIPIEMGIHSGTMHTINFCKTQKKLLLILRPPRDVNNAKVDGIWQIIEEQKKYPRELVRILTDTSEIEHEIYSKRTPVRGQLRLFDSVLFDKKVPKEDNESI